MGSDSDSVTSHAAGEDVVYSAFLSVHPSVVFKLGADLITDDIQALVELVKNSYDAESPYCNVTIDTDAAVSLRGPKSDQDLARGIIRIEDAGSGMRRQDIIDGWLTVSASKKGALKRELKASNSQRRTPLGDKGLGRLGAQRLGRSLVLTTYPRLQPGETRSAVPAHRVTIVWSDFDNVSSLQAVPIKLEVIEAPEDRVGSTIEIRGLRDRSTWASQSAESSVDLEREFGTMLSPYDSQNGFVVNVRINGETIDLRERAREVLDKSTLSYTLDYQNQILHVGVGVASSYLRPATGAQDIADFDVLVGADNGFSFLNWLAENESGAMQDLAIRGGDDQRFLFASTDIALGDVDPERDLDDDDASPDDGLAAPDAQQVTAAIADPGPFSGRVDQVILRYDPTRGLFDSRTEYSDFVKTLSGVRIYRDGFGVRVNPDWINLASQWSSGRSWYTLRPENTLGYVNLSARDNDRLEETTNREAFRETPAFRNFMRLLAAWLSYGSRVQEVVRRGYLDYKRSLMEKNAELPPSMAPAEVVKRIRDQAQNVESSATSLERAQRGVSGLADVSARLGRRAKESEERIFAEPEETRALSEASDEIQKLQMQLAEVLSAAQAELADFRNERAMLDVLADQIESQEEQLREVWEAIALGLVAETLSHEVLNLTQRLRGRSAQILTYLSQLDSPDRRVWSFAEDTRSIASALAKQVSRLDPSLRYVRDKRDRFSMGEFVQDLAEFYTERWAGQPVEVRATTLKDFSVVMNRGRLQQVLDNLVLNSHYWVRRDLRQQRLDRGLIEMVVDDPLVTVVDNGPGIDPAVEHLLFDPFITTKTAHEGRGLGLYIARQLLDADSASIQLASVRNSRDRLTTFALDFSRTEG